ncbi:MAG: CBS-domain-containing membrane protein [Colwellia sp.]|jgi:CBS-domain-containing membrane protein
MKNNQKNKLLLSFIAGFGTFLAIFILAFLSDITSEGLWLMAPFGATAVLVFGLPKSPLAQPKNVIFGHVLTAFVGLSFVSFGIIEPWTMALATGIAVSLMFLTNTTHPPAGANPLLILMTQQDWPFLFNPVLAGAISIVLVGCGINMFRNSIIVEKVS